LLAGGHWVRALVQPDDPATGDLPEAIELRVGDVTVPASLRPAVDRAEAIVHLAAVTAPGIGTPRQYFTSIAAGTFNLLEAAGDLRRFVFASSVAVYFAAPHHPPRFTPVTEHHPALPATPYGAAKLVAETLVLTAWRRRRLPAVVLRLTATLEPSELVTPEGVFARDTYPSVALRWYTRPGHPSDPTEARFVAALTPHAQATAVVLVHRDADGRSPIGDIAHPADAADAVAAALGNPAAVGEIFNIGPPAPHSQERLAAHLAQRLGYSTAVVPPPGGVARSWTASIAKARSILGYSPSRDVVSMVDEAVAAI
jgi:UDP-glucose 4-epimerase